MPRPTDPAARWDLIRHPPPSIAPGICYGRLDIEALPGFRAPRVARPDFVWSSPSRRCLALAGEIGRRHRRRPVVDRRLLELDFGVWEGVAWDDIPRARLDGWAHAPLGRGAPGGESGAGLIWRVRSFASLIAARPGRHVVVSHGGPLVVLARLLEGSRPDLAAPRPTFGAVVRPCRAGLRRG
jgi:alpha-ribazole phosphatase